MSESISELAKALSAFQAEMPTVPKSQTAKVPTKAGGSYSYTYASLADVAEVAMPLLTKHGLSFTCLPRFGEHGGELVGMLLHSSGESLSASLPIQGRQAQEIGSSLTYGRRYLLGCMTGLVTDDDDDGNLAQQSKPQQPKAGSVSRKDGRVVGGASQKQVGMIGGLMSKLGMTDRDLALAFVADVIGHQVTSRNDLTSREASKVIDALNKDLDYASQSQPADPWATENGDHDA